MAKKKAAKKKAAKTKPAAKTKASRKKKGAEPASRGLTPAEVDAGGDAAGAEALAAQVEADGGTVVGRYRDPLGGSWQLLAVLPLEQVQPTPFQRDLSATHVKRLGEAIGRLDRFLDPVIVVRHAEGLYWTPNGHHRTAALRELGARSVTCLVLPEQEMAFQILALNTEKAHNLKEKSLEVIRMARALADLDASRSEEDYAAEFEEPPLLTLGCCYDQKARFAGSTYNPVLKKVDAFLPGPLPDALQVREARAGVLLELDEAVNEAVQALKARGFESPYLKAFVVARINPIRGRGKPEGDFDATFATMLANARAFDASSVGQDQLASARGAPAED